VDGQSALLLSASLGVLVSGALTASSLEVSGSSNGLILTDELGGRWRITINSSGNLIQTSL
jgi:hypothetical protein